MTPNILLWTLTHFPDNLSSGWALGYDAPPQGKDTGMKRLIALALVMAFTGISVAQDSNNPDELKKSLAAALEQLKAAQDRKNELATENEHLKTRISELERQVNEQSGEIQQLREKTWFWRAHFAAWMKFIERYPELLTRWQVFVDQGPFVAPHLPDWTDPAAKLSQSK